MKHKPLQVLVTESPCLTTKNSAVKEATVLLTKSQKGVDYEALDGQPTYLFFYDRSSRGRERHTLASISSAISIAD